MSIRHQNNSKQTKVRTQHEQHHSYARRFCLETHTTIYIYITHITMNFLNSILRNNSIISEKSLSFSSHNLPRIVSAMWELLGWPKKHPTRFSSPLHSSLHSRWLGLLPQRLPTRGDCHACKLISCF